MSVDNKVDNKAASCFSQRQIQWLGDVALQRRSPTGLKEAFMAWRMACVLGERPLCMRMARAMLVFLSYDSRDLPEMLEQLRSEPIDEPWTRPPDRVERPLACVLPDLSDVPEPLACWLRAVTVKSKL